MIALIISLVTIFVFIIIFFLFIFLWSEDSRLEKHYKLTVENIRKTESISKIGITLKTHIIVDSGHKYSRLRTVIKKIKSRIQGYGILDTVLIFNMNSTEQKAFLILEAIKGSLFHIELLDAVFTEDLSKYHAFRYASETESVNNEVKFILRKNFEESPNRGCITKLMDPKYSEEVVLNPPPTSKGLLEEIVLPTVIEWAKQLKDINAPHVTKERFKSLFMDFIEGLCNRTWGILFIGLLHTNEYLDLFSSNIHKCSKGVLLAARGSYIPILLELWDQLCSVSQERWGTNFHAIDIVFQSTYPPVKNILCYRKFVSKSSNT